MLKDHELISQWNELKEQMLKKGIDNCSQNEKDTLVAMRKEIDRRQSGSRPSVQVNYSDYLTD